MSVVAITCACTPRPSTPATPRPEATRPAAAPVADSEGRDAPGDHDLQAVAAADPPLPACAPPPTTTQARIPSDVAGAWGFVRADGTTAIAAEYDEVELFSGGLARVRKGRRWGMIDVDGEVRVPILYAALGDRMPVTWARDPDGAVAVIDSCGQVLVPGPFLEVLSIRDGRVVASRAAEAPNSREYALLDLAGRPRIPWGPEKIVHKYDGLAHVQSDAERYHGDLGWRILDRDGDERFAWPGRDPYFCCQGHTVALATDVNGRDCLIDRDGKEIIRCGAYADLRVPPDYEVARLWAREGGRWGLIDFSGGAITTVVPHAYAKIQDAGIDSPKGMIWASAETERVLYDLDGAEHARDRVDQPLLDFGAMPADCGGLVRWEDVEAGERDEEMSDGIDTFTAVVPYAELRFFDAAGKVRRKVVDGRLIGGRWLLDRGRLRDVCGVRPALRGRWTKVHSCGESTRYAFAVAKDGVTLLDLERGAAVFTVKGVRDGGCDERSFQVKTGKTVGLLDLEGRTLVPQIYHGIDEVTIDGVEVYKLDYFGAEFYRDAAHAGDLGGRRPPGEFPETAEREIPVVELRSRDRATLDRMLVEMHARYGYRVPDEHAARFEATDWYTAGEYDDYDDPQPELLGPIERVNAKRIAAALARAR
ncbi:MAG: WG repeat-containing protein [Nannocystaceae bacterium]